MTSWDPAWIPAYLSNGLIGLRTGPIPLVDGLATVNGLAALQPVDRVEGFARAPYPVGGDVAVDGRSLRARRGAARLVEQRYDFSSGELATRFVFEGVEVEVLTFCSRTEPSLVVQRTMVVVDAPCELALTAIVDPVGIGGRWLKREAAFPATESHLVDGALLWETHGALSRCGAAYCSRLTGADGAERAREERDELAPLSTTYRFRAEPGRRYSLDQLTALVPEQLHSAPDRQAIRMASIGAQIGFDELRRENRAAWEGLWRGRLVLVGADSGWQAMADAAFYYLHASSHPSSLFSTAMFGLAYWPNYHYYRGQVMWDIEAFAFPALALTTPDTAAALLDFRFERMGAAQDNAALNGLPGLQFPWAATPRRGEEGTRTDAPVVLFEQHVNFWIALAFARYAHLVGDQDFIRDRAWPVLNGVASWTQARGASTDRGFEIRRALGPAEGREGPVDNNACVNMAASAVLREAAGLAARLGRDQDARRWHALADSMFVATNGAGVVLNHDRFTPAEGGVTGATPEALIGIFPAGYRLTPAAEAATIDFYLDRVEPYIGSPMLSAPLGVFAGWRGDRARAAALFEAGYGEYVFGPYMETHEFSRVRHPEKPLTGPFFANLGGFLTSCLYGLTGLEPSAEAPSTWFRRPAAMPELWDGIQVDRVWVRGEPAALSARHGEPARLESG